MWAAFDVRVVSLSVVNRDIRVAFVRLWAAFDVRVVFDVSREVVAFFEFTNLFFARTCEVM